MVGAWERTLEARRRKQAIDAAARRYAMQTELRDWREYVPEPEPVVFERPSRFSLPTGTPLITPSGETPTTEDYEVAGQFAMDALFGPERQSVLPGDQQASLPERFVRDWGLSEQEFRLAGQRASEGRVGPAIGWGLLGLAGAIPFVGDVGRLAGAAGDVARGAERAADVGRSARSADVYQQISSEISSGGVKFSLPDDVVRQIPEDRRIFAEVLYRQGFSGLPRRITVEDFRRLASDPEYIQVHRGIRGGEVTRGSDIGSTIDAEDAAFDLINGDLYIGGGTAGNGIYFTSDGDLAIDFARGAEGRSSDAPGAVVTGFLPRSARIADLGGPLFREYIEETGGTVARTRPFDFSTFAAMRGYDAVRVNDSNYIVLNRSSMLMVDEPGMFLRGSTRLPPQNRERFVAAERAADVASSGRGFAGIVEPVNEIDEVISGIAAEDQVISMAIDQPFIRSQGPDGKSLFVGSVDMPSNRESLVEYISPTVGSDINDPDVVRIIDYASGQFISVRSPEDFMEAARMVVMKAEDDGFWPSSEIAVDPYDDAIVRPIAVSIAERAELLADAHNEIVVARVSDMLEEIGYPRIDEGSYGVSLSNIADSLRKIEPNLEPAVAVYGETFLKILEDGEFLPQYITGDSNGLYDPMYRFSEETSKIGIDPSSVDRPIYGYLGTRDDLSGVIDASTNEMFGGGVAVEFGTASQYGNLNIVFDRNVLDRSTFTLGDSLGADLYAVPASRLKEISPAEVRLAGGQNATSGMFPEMIDYIELQMINPKIDDIKEIILETAGHDIGPDGSMPVELSDFLSEVNDKMLDITGRPANITVVIRRGGRQLWRKYDPNTRSIIN